MGKNIKLGNNTLTEVSTIKVQDADVSNTYDSFVDTTDANAITSDIISGKTAYVNGVLIIGSIAIYDGTVNTTS